jgi:hypothetical protein
MTYREYFQTQIEANFGLIALSRKNISQLNKMDSTRISAESQTRLIKEQHERIESLTREIDVLLKYREAIKSDNMYNIEVSDYILGIMEVTQ